MRILKAIHEEKAIVIIELPWSLAEETEVFAILI
jgi:hypothetical protein